MDLTDKTLLLIDGSSYIYRAFHAIRNLSNAQGEPTNALFGVLNMLHKTQEEQLFDYCCFVCDAKGKNFRHQMYADYKATRKPMPEELRPQIAWINQLVDLLGWNILTVPNVEADDVIATLNKQAKIDGMKVIISTGDKDIAQLVDEDTELINTMTDEKLDIAGVKSKFGVYPNQIVDYLTLIGDTSDNVPGVEKCGPKTAVKWLAEYQSLDNLIAHIDSIKGKVGENLKTALQWLPLSKQLILLKDDVDLTDYLPKQFENLSPKTAQWDLLLPLFHRFGFKKWIKQAETKLQADNLTVTTTSQPSLLLKEAPPRQPILPATLNYTAIQTETEFQLLLQKLAQTKLVGFDTETTSLDEMQAKLIGLSFAFSAGEAYYIPIGHNITAIAQQLDYDYVLQQLKPYLESKQLHKIGQNIKYDKHVLQNHEINLQGIVGDSMLASYIVESHLGHGLDELALRHLGLKTIKYEDLCGKGVKQISFADVNLADATAYACQDADFTLRLEPYLVSLMNQQQLNLYRNLELPILEILYKMERYGVLLDKIELQTQSHQLAKQILALQTEIFNVSGQEFNLNSPKQLQNILFTQLKIPTQGLKKTPKGDISTNEEVLEKLALDYSLPKLILEYRSLAKLKSTYTDKLPLMLDSGGRVHTTYAQAIANTGRLASNNPNLQNIPIRTEEGRKIRKAFIAPKGCKIVSADYSQVELRIMAHLSEDTRMIAAFNRGEDIHRSTAAEIFHIDEHSVTPEQRRYAKTINFGLIYGMGQYGLAKALNISNFEAKQFIDRYFTRYPGVLNYMERTKESAQQNGFVETILGRKLYLLNINSSNGNLRQGAQRAAINAPMQGTASDLIKLAMISVNQWLISQQLKTKMIMQVHDELVFEVRETELAMIQNNIAKIMSQVVSLKVPLVVDIGVGDNWEEAH